MGQLGVHALEQRARQEAAELESVVKIYETMKPKDAARILSELEMKVLLGIMEKMNGRRTAPILAAMPAARAREVTEELARRKAVNLTGAGSGDGGSTVGGGAPAGVSVFPPPSDPRRAPKAMATASVAP